MPPIIPRPAKNSDKPEAQLHYESLISFLKYAIGITGTLIALIVSVAIYFSYSSASGMKKEYRESIADFKYQITELKNEARQTNTEIKSDAKETVTSTKEYSENEISKIRLSTSEIAISETRRQIANIFATDKIQDLIENQASKEIKGNVLDIIAAETKILSSVYDAAAEMSMGKLSGLKRLKSYFTTPASTLQV